MLEPLIQNLEFYLVLSIILLVITLKWSHLNLLLVAYFCSEQIVLYECRYVKLLQHYVLLGFNVYDCQIRTIWCKFLSCVHAVRNDFQGIYTSLKHELNNFWGDSFSLPWGKAEWLSPLYTYGDSPDYKNKAWFVTLEKINRLLVSQALRLLLGSKDLHKHYHLRGALVPDFQCILCCLDTGTF